MVRVCMNDSQGSPSERLYRKLDTIVCGYRCEISVKDDVGGRGRGGWVGGWVLFLQGSPTYLYIIISLECRRIQFKLHSGKAVLILRVKRVSWLPCWHLPTKCLLTEVSLLLGRFAGKILNTKFIIIYMVQVTTSD